MPDEILMEKMDVFNRVIAEFVIKTSELQKTTEIFVEIYQIFDCIEDSLGEYWQMEGQYAELKIREMIAYLSASNTPAEVETIFKRFLSCTPSHDFIRQTADGIGEFMESHYQEILAKARQEESIPPETCVVSVSLDGVTN